MPVEHLNITLPIDLRQALDHEAKREHTKRSTLIQKALALYLHLAKQESLRKLLKEGYVEMASETHAVVRAFEGLDRESLKYVD